MKHTAKITTILILMFLLTQLIGLAVVNFYLDKENTIPYGFDQKEEIAKTPSFYTQFLTSLIFSFAIAILLIFFIMKIKSPWIMRIWFFIVITIALGITLAPLFIKLNLPMPAIISLALALILAYFKVFKRNMVNHNLTELLIYPGIAAIFVTMLNLPVMIVLLIIISVYDIWAVWHSGIMQKMAKYQMNEVGIFGGFFIPYASQKIKDKIKLLRQKYKNDIPQNVIKKNKLKINLAILGGGDVVFPIIAAGVVLKTWGNIYSSLAVVLFSCIALLYLFIFAEKKKYYPAMPYLTVGIYVGIFVGWLIKIFF
jgi:presenilin-like A22 family membrane protease